MASLITHSQVNIAAAMCDYEYSWPDNTCIEVVLRLLQILGKTVPTVPYLEKYSEFGALRQIVKHYNSSWGNYGVEWLTKHKLGVQIPCDCKFKTGDIVEVALPLEPKQKRHQWTIGVIATDAVYLRGSEEIIAVPTNICKFKTAARIL